MSMLFPAEAPIGSIKHTKNGTIAKLRANGYVPINGYVTIDTQSASCAYVSGDHKILADGVALETVDHDGAVEVLLYASHL